MGRLSYEITDDNRRRLEILRAFSVINRQSPTLQDLVNESIEEFFIDSYNKYCEQCSQNDFLKAAMEEMLPSDCQTRLHVRTIHAHVL